MGGAELTVIFARWRGRLLLEKAATGMRVPTIRGADRPAERARAAMEGAHANLSIARVGPTTEAEGTTLVPVLLDVYGSADRIERPDSKWEAVHATTLLKLDSDLSFWPAYQAVAPTVETILGDETHGSSTVSIRALEVLRNAAVSVDSVDELRPLAIELATGRPELVVCGNRIDRAMTAVIEREWTAAVRRLESELDRAANADDRAARFAATRCVDCAVVTHSRSGTIRQAIDIGEIPAVTVLESRPGGEGVTLAESLVEATTVTLVPDAAHRTVFETGNPDVVLVGADAIGPDGTVQNKVGTLPLAKAAQDHGCPVLVCSSLDKVVPETLPESPPIDREDVYVGEANLSVGGVVFDRTPADCIDCFVTEHGTVPPGAIESIADRHRNNRRWRTRT